MAHLSEIERKFYDEPLRSFETTPLKQIVWSPIDSLPDSGDEEDSISEEYLYSLIDGAMEVLVSQGLPFRLPNDDDVIDGMEVGDDRCDIASNPFLLALSIYCQSRVMRFETSQKDTGISKDIWNFCEVTSVVPSTTLGTIQRAKKRGYDEVEFVDSPPLRIIIDCQKGDRSHSSSASGKAGMLGSRVKYSRNEARALLETSSWLQDSMLNVCKAPDPKYLPVIMGGCGCTSLWGAWQNTYLFLKSFKNGTYQRVYASALNELKSCINELEGHYTTQPVLCSRLRQKQDYLHITYAGNVAVPFEQTPVKPVLDEVKPLYRALGGSALCQGVENRLVQAHVILTRSQAMAELDISDNLVRTLFGVNQTTWSRNEAKIASRTARAEFDYALRANTAVKHLIDRNANNEDLLELAKGEFILAGSGTTQLTHQLVEWIHLGGKGESFTIEDLTFSEDMYSFEEVSLRGSMRVAGIPLRPLFNQRDVVEKKTVSEIGLWQMSETKLEWANNIYRELVSLRDREDNPSFAQVFPIFDRNREWVNDDSLLVRTAMELAKSVTKVTLVLVSSDKRLGRRMARSSGLPVARVDPLDVVLNNPEHDYNSYMTLSYMEVFATDYSNLDVVVDFPPVFGPVMIDTGSMEAIATKFNRTISPGGSATLNHVTLVKTGVNNNGFRFETQKRFPQPGIRTVRIMVHAPNGIDRTTRPKRVADVRETNLMRRAKASISRFARQNLKS